MQMSTYEELNNSGQINLIQNEQLKIQMIELYREYRIASEHFNEVNNFTSREIFSKSVHIGSKYFINDLYDEKRLFQGSDWTFINDPNSENFKLLENTNQLMHSADIPATILDYAGLPIPIQYIGKSYKKVIEQPKTILREVIIGNTTSHRDPLNVMGRPVEGYWLRDKNWFFRWNVTENEVGLFDMKNDPNNDKNLVEENPDLVGLFSQKIEAWKKTKNL